MAHAEISEPEPSDKKDYEPTRTGLSPDTLASALRDNLYYTQGRVPEVATLHDWYAALAFTVRDRLLQRWIKTVQTLMQQDIRVVSYLSAEFLMGPHLGNALVNLGIVEETRQAVAKLGLDLDDLLLYGNQTLNILLQPNDVINVPVDKLISVYVFGAVRNPGKIEVKMSKKITLLQAVGNAGGLADGAGKSGIRLKRKDRKTGAETQIKINLGDIIKGKRRDIELQEGDVIIIPESFW